MRVFTSTLMTFLLVGCTSAPSIQQVPKLNGYWEIAMVTFADGQEKEYNISTTVDYIEISGNKGFKKKVHPKLDGTYSTSDDAEFFTINQRGEALFLRYNNDLSQWEEQLLKISDDSYTIINEEQISYTYKRFTTINIKP